MWRRPALIALLLAAAGCGLLLDDEARYQRALEAYSDGAYQSAIIDLKTLLQSSPDDSRARALLGRALLATGDHDSAAKEFGAALELGHPLDGLRAELAETWIATGQPERALDVADPDLAEYAEDAFRLRLLRGDALAAMGETLGALREYDTADRMDGDPTAALRHAAELHWGAGHIADARFLLELSLARVPDDPDTSLTLAAVLLDADEPAAAMRLLAETPAQESRDTETQAYSLFYEIRARLAEGDVGGARAALERLSTLWPADTPELTLATAEVSLAAGEHERAARSAQAYLALDEESEIALRILGTAQLRRGLDRQAEEWLQAALRRDPDRADTHRLLGLAYLRLGDRESADEYLAWAFDLEPADPWTAAMLGTLALPPDPVSEKLLGEDPAAAMEAAATGVEERPQDSAAWHRLGLAQLAAGRVPEARTSLERARSLASGEDELIRLDLARAALANGDARAAAAALGALPAAPDEDYAWTLLAVLAERFASGDADEADRRRLAAWVEAFPDDIEARVIEARDALDTGDYARAAKRYEALIEDGYLSADVYNNLAWCYLQTGDTRARALAETALRLDPEDGAALDTLGWILATAGEHGAALPLLRDAALLRPGDSEIAAHLAATLVETGREEEALGLLTRHRLAGRDAPALRTLWDDLTQNQ